jgi:hypothetical protein
MVALNKYIKGCFFFVSCCYKASSLIIPGELVYVGTTCMRSEPEVRSKDYLL